MITVSTLTGSVDVGTLLLTPEETEHMLSVWAHREAPQFQGLSFVACGPRHGHVYATDGHTAIRKSVAIDTFALPAARLRYLSAELGWTLDDGEFPFHPRVRDTFVEGLLKPNFEAEPSSDVPGIDLDYTDRLLKLRKVLLAQRMKECRPRAAGFSFRHERKESKAEWAARLTKDLNPSFRTSGFILDPYVFKFLDGLWEVLIMPMKT